MEKIIFAAAVLAQKNSQFAKIIFKVLFLLKFPKGQQGAYLIEIRYGTLRNQILKNQYDISLESCGGFACLLVDLRSKPLSAHFKL